MDWNELIIYINEARDACDCLQEEVDYYLEHNDKDKIWLREKLLAITDMAIDCVKNARRVIKET